MSTDDLVTSLRAQLDEDEQWALACNRPYEFAADDARAPADGVHWRWVVGENWETAVFDPVLDEFVAPPGYSCNLATVEEWASGSWPDRLMPRTYANDIVEMDSSAAGHIARWDPARVLRNVEVNRRILDRCERAMREQGIHGEDGQDALAEDVLRLLAHEGVRRSG